LGNTVLKTYRTEVSLHDLVPNTRQPRLGPKEDVELQRQIEANQGIFEPLLVEPHPDNPKKYRIIDGERRWTNSKILVEVHKKNQYSKLPVEVIDRTLTDEERWRVWIYIHRQRKEWEAKEKEMAAYSLVSYTNRATAANILGITVRELDKLCEIYELSEKMTKLPDPSTSITYAREIKNIARGLLSPEVENAIVKKANDGLITNSKEIRQLRKILRNEDAKKLFLREGTTISDTVQKFPGQSDRNQIVSLSEDLGQLIEVIKSRPWSQLMELRGDQTFIDKLAEVERIILELKKAVVTPA